MDNTKIIVDGVVTIVQNIVFGSMVVACVYLLTKYKREKPSTPKPRSTARTPLININVPARKEKEPKKIVVKEQFDDGEEETLDLETGELVVKKKRGSK